MSLRVAPLRFDDPSCSSDGLPLTFAPPAGIRATKEKLQAAKSTIEAEGKLIVDAVDQLAEEAAKVRRSLWPPPGTHVPSATQRNTHVPWLSAAVAPSRSCRQTRRRSRRICCRRWKRSRRVRCFGAGGPDGASAALMLSAMIVARNAASFLNKRVLRLHVHRHGCTFADCAHCVVSQRGWSRFYQAACRRNHERKGGREIISRISIHRRLDDKAG